MNGAVVWMYLSLVVSGICLGLLVVTTIRVWHAQRKAMKSLKEYSDALNAARLHILANPQSWLDMMKDQDDKRRLN